MVGFKLTQSQATFDKLVLNALAQEVDKYFRTSRVKRFWIRLQQAVRAELKNSLILLESLSWGGKLRGAFGIPSGQDVMYSYY